MDSMSARKHPSHSTKDPFIQRDMPTYLSCPCKDNKARLFQNSLNMPLTTGLLTLRKLFTHCALYHLWVDTEFLGEEFVLSWHGILKGLW